MEAARVAGASNTTTKGRGRCMVVTSGAGRGRRDELPLSFDEGSGLDGTSVS